MSAVGVMAMVKPESVLLPARSFRSLPQFASEPWPRSKVT